MPRLLRRAEPECFQDYRQLSLFAYVGLVLDFRRGRRGEHQEDDTVARFLIIDGYKQDASPQIDVAFACVLDEALEGKLIGVVTVERGLAFRDFLVIRIVLREQVIKELYAVRKDRTVELHSAVALIPTDGGTLKQV